VYIKVTFKDYVLCVLLLKLQTTFENTKNFIFYCHGSVVLRLPKLQVRMVKLVLQAKSQRKVKDTVFYFLVFRVLNIQWC